MNQKRLFALLTAAAMTAALLTGCGGAGDKSAITVISREEGSGTRGAFTELTGVLEKDADGNKTDMTTVEAITQTKTDVVLSAVAGDAAAIGYVSLGAVNAHVQAMDIDGVAASTENVQNGTYKLVRPFNIATKDAPDGLTQDFLSFILSADGQAVASSDFIAADDNAPAFKTDGSAGKITVGGSSSIAPLMEKLIEAYQRINGAAEIELQSSDSTSGMTGAIDGTFDIGMASRELSDTERAELVPAVIALDGIAVIVSAENPVGSLTLEQVRQIFVGELTSWSDIK